MSVVSMKIQNPGTFTFKILIDELLAEELVDVQSESSLEMINKTK